MGEGVHAGFNGTHIRAGAPQRLSVVSEMA